MKKSLVLLVFSFLLGSINAFADSKDTNQVVNFRLVDAVTGNPVELAHVINRTHHEEAIADKLGYFKIPLFDGDTLSVTSIGYFNQFIHSWGQYNDDSTFYTVQLKPRSYSLKELKFTWFSNYDKFIKGVSELRLPLTKEEESTIRITEYFNRTIKKLDLKDLPGSSSGMLFGIDWLAKQNEQLDEKLKKESLRRAVERKYSAGIVSAITGLIGNEVHWFMEYCAITDEYVLKTSDYDIRNKILDKFKIYNSDKSVKDKK